MNKKEYIEPVCDVISLADEDIIVTSGNDRTLNSTGTQTLGWVVDDQ